MTVTKPLDLAARIELPLLIVFADLTRFAAQSARVSETELADTMDAFYERVATRTTAAAGKVVKFIGDAALLVFQEESLDAGVRMLLDLKDDVDSWFGQLGWECRLVIKAHFGPVIAGPFGPPGDKRFDVLGKTVNAAAMLGSTGVTLSSEAFQRLSPELRQRFKQHTPPITYVRIEDPERSRQR